MNNKSITHFSKKYQRNFARFSAIIRCKFAFLNELYLYRKEYNKSQKCPPVTKRAFNNNKH